MTRHCCVPGCDVTSSSGVSLFKVPAKRFCSGKKHEWADKLERVIRSIRKDKWLDDLYKRDDVTICKRHFLPTDILPRGSITTLRTGAVPTLKLPQKSVETNSRAKRPLPADRPIPETVTHNNLNDIKKSSIRYLPQSWQCEVKSNLIVVHSGANIGTIPRTIIKIDDNMKLQAGHYGWFTHMGNALAKVDIKKSTLTTVIHEISNFPICQGIIFNNSHDFSNNRVVNHYKMHYNSLSDMPDDPQPPKTVLIAVRSRSCEIFLNVDGKCQPCLLMEQQLNKVRLSRENYKKKVESKPLSRATPRGLISRQVATVKLQEEKLKELEHRVKYLLEDAQTQVQVDPDLSSDFEAIFSNGMGDNNVSPFFRLFWKEQAKLNAAAPCGKRFHPELIRFCLRMALKSTAAYEQLRESGILVLPSTRTLFEYRSRHASSPGFLNSMKEELTEKAKSMADHERLLVLSMDEIKVKESIVYSVSMDKMVGFVDLDESRTSCSNEPATHALQVYVRGLVAPFSKPIAYYASKSLASYQLTSIFWECVGNLEECGFKVVAFISDGLSANRKMFYELNNLHLKYPYKCVNIFCPERVIYLIFDPPHLLKTVRNNLYASRTGGTKLLKKDGKHICWEHFTAVPKLFQTSELRCCKLSDAHFQMKSFSKMRVSYAAQLLSNTVARLMRARGGFEMEASAWFADIFNKWFDLMNSTTKFSYNDSLRPYRSVDDPRLLWLENDFLPQLRGWKSMCVGSTVAEKSKQFLSWQTYEGLEISTMAVVELVRTLLPWLPKGSYIITRRLNQDPLEAFFGHIRRSGGTCENPDIYRYGYLQRIIGVEKNLNHEKALKGSNVNTDDLQDPIPKRKRQEPS